MWQHIHIVQSGHSQNFAKSALTILETSYMCSGWLDCSRFAPENKVQFFLKTSYKCFGFSTKKALSQIAVKTLQYFEKKNSLFYSFLNFEINKRFSINKCIDDNTEK